MFARYLTARPTGAVELKVNELSAGIASILYHFSVHCFRAAGSQAGVFCAPKRFIVNTWLCRCEASKKAAEAVPLMRAEIASPPAAARNDFGKQVDLDDCNRAAPKQKHPMRWGVLSAERAGFEPAFPCGKHALQACALNRATRPLQTAFRARRLYHVFSI